MLVTALIAFREGLEAFLLVGILLAYLGRIGGKRYARWIYAGVAAGLVASLVVAFVLQVVIDQFSGDFYRAVVTAAVMLIACCILTYMAVWMHKRSKAETEHAKAQLQSFMTAGNVIGIAMLAFISVLREGIETVLFLSALAYSGQEVSIPGGLIGLAAALLLVYLLISGTRRVPLHLFFRYSSLLLIVIAAGLLGSAVLTLQGVGLFPGPTAPLFDISGVLSDTNGVGVFLRGLFGYNSSPTAPQFGLWAAYLVIAVIIWWRGYAQKAR
jgi:high-affinity iron transporter